jgi:hypothetical protein
MKPDDLDIHGRKASDPIPASPIPGDPFPWQPAPAAPASEADDPGLNDIYPVDLGGGD